MKVHTFKVGDTGAVLRDCEIECVEWKKGDRFKIVEADDQKHLRVLQIRDGEVLGIAPWFHNAKYLLENVAVDQRVRGVEVEQITRLFHSYTVYKGKDAELWHDSAKKSVRIKEGRKSRTVSVADVADLPSFVEGFFASKV